MSSIRWGLGTGADLCVPFTGNATLSGCRLIGAGGADDHIALDWNALKEASRIIKEQRKRIEELSLLLGERDKGPGEVRA